MIVFEHPAVATLVRQIAARWEAGLFLCGSRLLGSSGADHDYRLVVDDLQGIFEDTAFLTACTGVAIPREVPHIAGVGMKFTYRKEIVSLQVLSQSCVRSLASLKPFKLHITRNTSTYHANVVHGFHREFSTLQSHTLVKPGTWRVSIDQSPWQHGVFSTQIYHNMLIASRLLRDAHGLAAHRFALVDAVRELARAEGLTDVEGVGRLLTHTTRSLRADARQTFIRCLLNGPSQEEDH